MASFDKFRDGARAGTSEFARDFSSFDGFDALFQTPIFAADPARATASPISRDYTVAPIAAVSPPPVADRFPTSQTRT